MCEINENQIISSIISKVNNDLDRYLRDINLKDLLELKNKSIQDSIQIRDLQEKNSKLLEEMNNFKKVSLLNTITNQIEEKNKEVFTLKQVIKNRDNTINQLKDRIQNIEEKLNLSKNNSFESNLIYNQNFIESNDDINNKFSLDDQINNIKKNTNLENKIEFVRKKLKGEEYYFDDNKLYKINDDLSKGVEVGIYLVDKNKFKFHK